MEKVPGSGTWEFIHILNESNSLQKFVGSTQIVWSEIKFWGEFPSSCSWFAGILVFLLDTDIWSASACHPSETAYPGRASVFLFFQVKVTISPSDWLTTLCKLLISSFHQSLNCIPMNIGPAGLKKKKSHG